MPHGGLYSTLPVKQVAIPGWTVERGTPLLVCRLRGSSWLRGGGLRAAGERARETLFNPPYSLPLAEAPVAAGSRGRAGLAAAGAEACKTHNF